MSVDRFDEYFRTAANNAARQLEADTVLMRRLRALHGAFNLLVQNLNEPSSQLSATFVLDVYAKFLAAGLLTLSGQLREAYPVLRAGLESAMYGVVLDENSELREAWFHRDSDQDARKKVRRQLASKAVLLDAVRRRDSALADAIDAQYEESITFGAHPNPLAVVGSLRISETTERTEYERPILGGSVEESAVALGDVIHYGANMLHVVTLLMPERSAILGIPETLSTVRLPWVAG